MDDWICRVLDERHSNLTQYLKIYSLYYGSGFHDGNYWSDIVVFYPFNLKNFRLEFEIPFLASFVKHSAKYVLNIQGVPRGNVPDFGRMFLKLKYTDIAQNTFIQSWTVTEIMAREVWKYDSCYTLIDYEIHIKTGRNMWFL